MENVTVKFVRHSLLSWISLFRYQINTWGHWMCQVWHYVQIARELGRHFFDIHTKWNKRKKEKERKKKTRGPWWSYIAHLSKQLCILTLEVSAKFTVLRFLYKFYSPAPQRPFFFHASWWLELNIERGSPKEQFCRYIEIGPVVSDKKIFKMSYIDIQGN